MDLWVALIMVGGTLGGVWLGGRMTRTTQVQALAQQAQAERAERFRQLLGQVRVLSTDGDPVRVSMNLGSHSAERVQDLDARWRAIWPELEGYALVESNEEIRAAVQGVTIAMAGVIHWDAWYVSDRQQGRSGQEALNEGRAVHAQLRDTIEELAQLLRATLD